MLLQYSLAKNLWDVNCFCNILVYRVWKNKGNTSKSELQPTSRKAILIPAQHHVILTTPYTNTFSCHMEVHAMQNCDLHVTTLQLRAVNLCKQFIYVQCGQCLYKILRDVISSSKGFRCKLMQTFLCNIELCFRLRWMNRKVCF